jgi:Family of unknown function (DUF6463)
MVIGVVHIVLTPVLYPDSWDSVLEAGVIASIEADETAKDRRSAGFWYATAGLGQIMFVALVCTIERRLGMAPRLVGWMMLGLAVWGVALVPNSGFWGRLPPSPEGAAAAIRTPAWQQASAGPGAPSPTLPALPNPQRWRAREARPDLLLTVTRALGLVGGASIAALLLALSHLRGPYRRLGSPCSASPCSPRSCIPGA